LHRPFGVQSGAGVTAGFVESWRTSKRGLNRNKIVVAIARELCGFVWAIAREIKPA
jgi:hypothetical protein